MYRPNVNEFELTQFRGNDFCTDFELQDQVSDWGSRLNSKALRSTTMFLCVLLRRVFKLILARWRSQPIKYRVRERQPITERLQNFTLKSRLSYLPDTRMM